MIRAALLSIFLLASSLQAADKLEDVLTNMDRAAARFRGLSAHLSYTKITVVVDDKTVETGTIYFQKEKNKYKVKVDITEPDPKTVLVRDGKARIYHRKTNLIEEYDLGQKKELMERFFLLGFGAGGHELAKVYGVTLAADCALGGKPCIKLDLQPRGEATRNLKRVELWLSKETFLPIQQQFTEPSNDYLTAHYSQIKEGPQNDSIFRIDAPKAKTVRPGS